MTTLARAGSIVIVPDRGSVWWRDEREHSTVAQSLTRVFGGALVAQEAAVTGGQPLTLAGGEPYAVIRQATLDALLALGAPAGAQITVTLDDARAYTCLPSRAGGLWIGHRAVEAGGAGSPLLPLDDDTWYWLDALRLIILAGPL